MARIGPERPTSVQLKTRPNGTTWWSSSAFPRRARRRSGRTVARSTSATGPSSRPTSAAFQRGSCRPGSRSCAPPASWSWPCSPWRSVGCASMRPWCSTRAPTAPRSLRSSRIRSSTSGWWTTTAVTDRGRASSPSRAGSAFPGSPATCRGRLPCRSHSSRRPSCWREWSQPSCWCGDGARRGVRSSGPPWRGVPRSRWSDSGGRGRSTCRCSGHSASSSGPPTADRGWPRC